MDLAPSDGSLPWVQAGARLRRSLELLGLRRRMWQQANSLRWGITRRVGVGRGKIQQASHSDAMLITVEVSARFSREGFATEFATEDFYPFRNGIGNPVPVFGFHPLNTEGPARISVSGQRGKIPALITPGLP